MMTQDQSHEAERRRRSDAGEQLPEASPVSDAESGSPTAQPWFRRGFSDMKNAAFRYMEEPDELEMPLDYAPKLLPWRIGFFLLTSTIVQNLCYLIPSYLTERFDWTMKQNTQFSSLVYTVLYLGPVFGFIIDLVRIFRERFRPIIVMACVVNAVVGFVCFATKGITGKYGACLMLSWIIEVSVMFMYLPMNAVVINYGNRVVESPAETSARVGGLMSQAMVWRTTGTLIYTIFFQFAYGTSSRNYVNYRWFCLIAAIFSCVLIFQVLFLTKRVYYTDHRPVSLAESEPVRFYRSGINMCKKVVSTKTEAAGGKFMFIVCFTFIYFMLPDPLYNTVWSFNYPYTSQFSTGLSHANAIISAIGAVIGALAYAMWMFFDQYFRAHLNEMFRVCPLVIVLAGCGAWVFGIFFHFWGEMGSSHSNFNFKVFIPFQSFFIAATLRFAFMPSLSLAAMHAPRFFETTAFQLYSVATSGGGTVAYSVTTSFMTSLGVTVTSGYWKALLIFMVLRMVPMVIAPTLPKFREDETLPVAKGGPHEPLSDDPRTADDADKEPAEYDTLKKNREV